MRHSLMTIQCHRLTQDLLHITPMGDLLCLHLALLHLLLVEVLLHLPLVEALLHLPLVEALLHLPLVEALSRLHLMEVLLRLRLMEALLHLCLAEVLLLPHLAEALPFFVEVLLLPLGGLLLQVLVVGPLQHLAAHLLGWSLVHGVGH